MLRRRLVLNIFFFLLAQCRVFSQNQNAKKQSIIDKAIEQGLQWITTNPNDTIRNDNSKAAYDKFNGRIIRKINIKNVGFETTVYDSVSGVKNSMIKLANSLHVNTTRSTIRNHLFIKEGEPLNPYKLADNERFLREKDFILDCQILVSEIAGTDSVDVNVLVRDVFSFGGRISGSFPSRPKISIYDVNIAGGGQGAEIISLIDQDRSPKFGYSLLYGKSSVLGSLANLEVGYTQTNTSRTLGDEEEFGAYIKVDRPLASQYTRVAGGFEVGHNWSKNVYNEPDSTFLSYKYSIFDTWLGRNFGIKKPIEDRNRQFLAVRYYYRDIGEQPAQPLFVKRRFYNDEYGILTEFSLYKQNYYKTRYIYGFGRTEDVPSGISTGLTVGYVKQISWSRPYIGYRLNFGQASNNGNIYHMLIQTGGYYKNNGLEDIILQLGADYRTRILYLKRYKSRNYISGVYSQIFNHRTIDFLQINQNILPGFSPMDLDASRRLSMHMESVMFTPWSLLGFNFAPFVALDGVNVNCISCGNINQTFMAISTGIRFRNENLIFGTFELKFTYVPSDINGKSKFMIHFQQNLRLEELEIFARRPSLINYN